MIQNKEGSGASTHTYTCTRYCCTAGLLMMIIETIVRKQPDFVVAVLLCVYLYLPCLEREHIGEGRQIYRTHFAVITPTCTRYLCTQMDDLIIHARTPLRGIRWRIGQTHPWIKQPVRRTYTGSQKEPRDRTAAVLLYRSPAGNIYSRYIVVQRFSGSCIPYMHTAVLCCSAAVPEKIIKT